MPIPSDTIVGMYHPWRDKIWDGFQSGIPFKNFLITDPVRQQYAWRKIAVENIKSGTLPLWNPYSFAGYPLLSNFQSAVFFPLNLLYIFFSFNQVWSLQVILQPFLAMLFMFIFLKNMKIDKTVSALFSFIYGFSGFSVAWMEWNTIGHMVYLLPVSLFFIDRITDSHGLNSERDVYGRYWAGLILSSVSAFFAGHIQIFLYFFLVVVSYLVFRMFEFKKRRKYILNIIIWLSVFFILTSFQWFPGLKFILQSSRSSDVVNFLKDGWFIPWQNLIQFISPDFFGNPATLNYFGIWNYGEFIGYIGIITLIAFVYFIFFTPKIRKDKFFLGLFIISLIFSLPNPFSRFFYLLNIPFISTSQPTRLMFIIVFCLTVLSSKGLDSLIFHRNAKKIILSGVPLIAVLISLWLVLLFFNPVIFRITAAEFSVSKRNLVLPSVVFFGVFTTLIFAARSGRSLRTLFIIIIFGLTVADQTRFAWKFLSFSKPEWLYPETEIISYIKDNQGFQRTMAVNREIMPPNFSSSLKIYDVSGYDPLYLSDYAKISAAWDRDKPDISESPFGRIITPVNFDSFMTDLLGVKYILSLNPLSSAKLRLIMNEGRTYLYENTLVFPRAYLVGKTVRGKDRQDEIEKMFDLNKGLIDTAVVSGNILLESSPLEEDENVKITKYSDNEVRLESLTKKERFLVLTDVYYPFWKAYINGHETEIFRTNLALRGILVPPGRSEIIFKASIL